MLTAKEWAELDILTKHGAGIRELARATGGLATPFGGICGTSRRRPRDLPPREQVNLQHD